MSHFVGPDVSQKITAICVRTAENMASSVPLRSTIPRASADPETRRPSGLGPQAVSVGRGHYVGGISKCGDRRMRTLLYEVANVMLTRYKGQLKVKLDWAVASPSDPRPEGAHPSGMPPRDHHARAAARRGSCAQMPFIP